MRSLKNIISIGARERHDVERLLELARDKSVAARRQLVGAVSDLFFGTTTTLSERERALMTEILRRLIHDVEMDVRRALAARLATEPRASSELVIALANDAIEVAHPILVKSSVLQDEELIEIIRHRTHEHQFTIAARERISRNVSDALVDTGNVDVILALLQNHGAQISQTTLSYLTEQAKSVDSYQQPLVTRPDLPADMAKRLYWWVSAALREHILKTFAIDAAELDHRIQDVIKELLGGPGRGGQIPRTGEELARKLAARGAVTPQLLVETLRQREMALFEALLGEMAGLRRNLVRQIMFEASGQSLTVVARALDIPRGDFANIFLLSRTTRPSDKQVETRELARVIPFFDRVLPEAAQRLLTRIRLDPDYLKSMVRIEPRSGAAAPKVMPPKAATSD